MTTAIAIRERILASIATAVSVVSDDYAAIKVYRDRGQDIPDTVLPAASLDDGGDSQLYHAYPCTIATLDLSIELRCTANSDDEIGTAMNALYARIAGIVMADPRQGGLAIDTNETGLGPLVKPSSADQDILGAATCGFQIEYQYLDGNPAVQF